MITSLPEPNYVCSAESSPSAACTELTHVVDLIPSVPLPSSLRTCEQSIARLAVAARIFPGNSHRQPLWQKRFERVGHWSAVVSVGGEDRICLFLVQYTRVSRRTVLHDKYAYLGAMILRCCLCLIGHISKYWLHRDGMLSKQYQLFTDRVVMITYLLSLVILGTTLLLWERRSRWPSLVYPDT